MTPASKSLYYFGFYLLLTGILLTVAPNFVLAAVQIEETKEVWIHVLGAVVFVIGLYYVFMAPTNNALFMMLSVYARITIFIWFLIFVILTWAPPELMFFGLVDMAGAIWTYLLLKRQG
ncbi:MAG TPA: hypothetical protein PLR06_04315 [Cyclobacteriaceae bacterium]|nr:hypothetical protein [Cyclobacteriaceae bacterium]